MTKNKNMEKRLTRNSSDKVIGGVCSGLADYFQLDATLVRVAFVLTTLFVGTGLWIYLILWIVLPEKRINIFKDSQRQEFEEFVDPVRDEVIKEKQRKTAKFIGLLFIALGLVFLLDEFDLIPYWFSISKLWPVVLVVIGLLLIFKNSGKSNQQNNSEEDINN